MKPNRKTLKQALAIAVLGVVAACGKEPPTAPDPGPPLPISADERAALGRVVDDAVAWLIPALEDPAAADALREALSGVALQLGGGGQKAFDRAIERANSVLASFDRGGTSEPGGAERPEEGTAVPDAPLMAMIRLTLSQVAALARPQPSADGTER